MGVVRDELACRRDNANLVNVIDVDVTTQCVACDWEEVGGEVRFTKTQQPSYPVCLCFLGLSLTYPPSSLSLFSSLASVSPVSWPCMRLAPRLVSSGVCDRLDTIACWLQAEDGRREGGLVAETGWTLTASGFEDSLKTMHIKHI